MWEKPIIEVDQVDPGQVTISSSNQVACDNRLLFGSNSNRRLLVQSD